MKLIIHTDGGARGNPGKGACAFMAEEGNPASAAQQAVHGSGEASPAFVLRQAQDSGEAKAGISREICGKYLGVVTNNEAEYLAVIEALKWVLNLDPRLRGDERHKITSVPSAPRNNTQDISVNPLLIRVNPEEKRITEVLIKSDSLLLVSQLMGKWKIKDRELQKLAAEVKKLEREVGAKISYQHIPRELNRDADREVNRILDRMTDKMIIDR